MFAGFLGAPPADGGSRLLVGVFRRFGDVRGGGWTVLTPQHLHTRCARTKVLGCETRWDKARRMRDEPHPGSFFFRPPRPSPCPDRRHVARLAAHFLGDEGAVLPFLVGHLFRDPTTFPVRVKRFGRQRVARRAQLRLANVGCLGRLRARRRPHQRGVAVVDLEGPRRWIATRRPRP